MEINIHEKDAKTLSVTGTQVSGIETHEFKIYKVIRLNIQETEEKP